MNWQSCDILYTGQSTLIQQKFPEIDISHQKLTNKSTDSSETTTSSEGKSSQSDGPLVARKLPSLEGCGQDSGQGMFLTSDDSS